MTPTPKQLEILRLFEGDKNKLLKKFEITKEVGGIYYYNEAKHVGDRLSRMVKSGFLIRPKMGVYRLGRGKAIEHADKNQLKLFDTPDTEKNVQYCDLGYDSDCSISMDGEKCKVCKYNV